jgi:hypothetical protein
MADNNDYARRILLGIMVGMVAWYLLWLLVSNV